MALLGDSWRDEDSSRELNDLAPSASVNLSIGLLWVQDCSAAFTQARGLVNNIDVHVPCAASALLCFDLSPRLRWVALPGLLKHH